MKPVIALILLQSALFGCTSEEALDRSAGGQDEEVAPELTTKAGSSAAPEAGDETEATAVSADGAVAADPALPCYSPRENLDLSQELFPHSQLGCACTDDPSSRAGYCIERLGGPMAIVCRNGRWLLGLDGPCFAPSIILPETCAPRGGEELPIAPERRRVQREDIPAACPDGRTLLGVVSYEQGDAPCCERL